MQLSDGFRHLRAVIVLALAAAALACNPVQFSKYEPAPLGPYVCDPFGGHGNDPSSGLSASLYYFNDGRSHGSADDYFNNGTKANATVYLSQLNVPTRHFTLGFAGPDGRALTMDNGQPLVEWFGLKINSTLKLAPGFPSDALSSEGDWQFLALSDDGIKVKFVDGNPNTTIIDGNSIHSNMLSCANRSVRFTNFSRVPIQVEYFQGPRTQIALILMARKGIGASSVAGCGTPQANEFYFDYTQNPSVPTANYQQLLNDGWRPIRPQNYEIPGGNNPCNH